MRPPETPEAPLPQVIFLNGASSSGKTTLARALQAQLEQPYIYVAEDQFFTSAPASFFHSEHFHRNGTRLYRGFAHCVEALVRCENLVIVDTAAAEPGSLELFVDTLRHVRVLFVGVHCRLEVLEQRELARGDRRPGLARRQLGLIHAHGMYDVEVDTSNGELQVCVASVLQATHQPLSAFEGLRQRGSSGG